MMASAAAQPGRIKETEEGGLEEAGGSFKAGCSHRSGEKKVFTGP